MLSLAFLLDFMRVRHLLPSPHPPTPRPLATVSIAASWEAICWKVIAVQSIPRNKCTYTLQSSQCSHFGWIKESHIWHFQKLLGNLLFNPVSGKPLKLSHSNAWDPNSVILHRKRLRLERKCEELPVSARAQHFTHSWGVYTQLKGKKKFPALASTLVTQSKY